MQKTPYHAYVPRAHVRWNLPSRKEKARARRRSLRRSAPGFGAPPRAHLQTAARAPKRFDRWLPRVLARSVTPRRFLTPRRRFRAHGGAAWGVWDARRAHVTHDRGFREACDLRARGLRARGLQRARERKALWTLLRGRRRARGHARAQKDPRDHAHGRAHARER